MPASGGGHRGRRRPRWWRSRRWWCPCWRRRRTRRGTGFERVLSAGAVRRSSSGPTRCSSRCSGTSRNSPSPMHPSITRNDDAVRAPECHARSRRERSGVDFQLQLVPTARIEGVVTNADGSMPPGTQVTLVPQDQAGVPQSPGLNTSTSRSMQNGRFSSPASPGQYRLMARGSFARRTPIRRRDVAPLPPRNRAGVADAVDRHNPAGPLGLDGSRRSAARTSPTSSSACSPACRSTDA